MRFLSRNSWVTVIFYLVSEYILQLISLGGPGFSLMAWFSGCKGGKCLAAFLLKICACYIYSTGRTAGFPWLYLSLFASCARSCINFVLATIIFHSASLISSFWLRVDCLLIAFICILIINATFCSSFHCCHTLVTVFKVINSFHYSLFFQLICGLKVLSYGYLSRTQSNPRSVT